MHHLRVEFFSSKIGVTHPEQTWWSISGQLCLRQQKFEGRSWGVLGERTRNEPGLRTGGFGTSASRVLRRLWTRADAPGAGTTLGKPGVLLSPELLRDPGDTPAELSEVSVRLSENLKQ